MFDEFFKSYAENDKKEKINFDQQQNNLRLLQSTKQEDYKKQKCDYTGLGRRHMKTRDMLPIQNEDVDRLFMVKGLHN